MFRRVTGLASAGLVAAAVLPGAALAHGGIATRKDLPIPPVFFAWGAAMALIVSFALLTISWREARLQDDEPKPVSATVSNILIGPVANFLAGAVGVFLFGLVIYTGLKGTIAVDRNFAGTFILVTFWLGAVGLNVLFGDVFKAFNPWRAIARAVSSGFRLIAGQPAKAPFEYPSWFKAWPAVLGIAAFVWLEIVYATGGLITSPEKLTIATLIYSGITFVAMALFGIDTWIEKGEAFSVYYRMFSRLSIFEINDQGRLAIRRPLRGLPGWEVRNGSLALVIAAISLTAFDGAQEGVLSKQIVDTADFFHNSLGFGIRGSAWISSSIWMVIAFAFVGGIYWLGIRGMRTVPGSPDQRTLMRSFAHTLIPIAFAYLIAHYFSYFVFYGQAQFTYLLSDPLGTGTTDLFGTANTAIDYSVISSTGIWYVQVASLVAGHVTALVLAHDRALALYKDHRKASRSQYWMLAVMVCFTTLGLFLLSKANG